MRALCWQHKMPAAAAGAAAALQGKSTDHHTQLSAVVLTWHSGVMPVPPPSRLMRRQRPSRALYLRRAVQAAKGLQDWHRATCDMAGWAGARQLNESEAPAGVLLPKRKDAGSQYFPTPLFKLYLDSHVKRPAPR